MRLVRYSAAADPFAALARLQSALDRVFEKPVGFDLGLSGQGVFPAVNVFSDDGGYVLRLELPGVPPENLTVESRENALSIAGKRETEAPAGGSLHRRERSGAEFPRSFQLPEDAEPGGAEARYEHGILTVRVPKREEAKPRQIEVRAQ